MNSEETENPVKVEDRQALSPERKAALMKRLMDSETEDENTDKDICRVCRLVGDETLYHPCLCTGSIKFVHQNCLLQWLKYSKKDVCELCNHKFSFKALYRPDMPESLPAYEIFRGIGKMGMRIMQLFFTYIMVATFWLLVVPLVVNRIYRLVFGGIISSFFSSRILLLFSPDSFTSDVSRGTLIVAIFLCTFISLIWLREQIMTNGPQEFLHLPEKVPNKQLSNAASNIPAPAPSTNNENNQPPHPQQENEQNRDVPDALPADVAAAVAAVLPPPPEPFSLRTTFMRMTAKNRIALKMSAKNRSSKPPIVENPPPSQATETNVKTEHEGENQHSFDDQQPSTSTDAAASLFDWGKSDALQQPAVGKTSSIFPKRSSIFGQNYAATLPQTATFAHQKLKSSNAAVSSDDSTKSTDVSGGTSVHATNGVAESSSKSNATIDPQHQQQQSSADENRTEGGEQPSASGSSSNNNATKMQKAALGGFEKALEAFENRGADVENNDAAVAAVGEANAGANAGAAAAVDNAADAALDRLDDLTWQRLLGLDGSFAFIEHVLWTIALNIVFIIVFLYWPSQIGSAVLRLCGVSSVSYFELPTQMFTGYVAISVHALGFHYMAKRFRMRKVYTMSALIFLIIRVFLLIIIEVIVFPIMCGWWLDICSLPLTGATLALRIKSFQAFPTSSIFMHWLCGTVSVFYSASFILILRELLRPGVLWFIRNLNDPDFNPIQEMIEQPMLRHIRRLIASTTLFFTLILLVVYVPLLFIKAMFIGVLPYSFAGSADTPLVEYSIELLLLQIVLPALLENSKAFSWLKKSVVWWCRIVGGWLKLDAYLLPAKRLQQQQAALAAAGRQQNQQQQRQNVALHAIEQANAAIAERQRVENGDAVGDQTMTGDSHSQKDQSVEGTEAADATESTSAVGDFAAAVSSVQQHRAAAVDHDVDGPIEDGTESSSAATSDESSDDDDSEADDIFRDIDEEPLYAGGNEAEQQQQPLLIDNNNLRMENGEGGGAGGGADAMGRQLPVAAAGAPLLVQAPPAGAIAPPQQPVVAPRNAREQNHLAARHQAMLVVRERTNLEAFTPPDFFAARIVALLCCLGATLSICSFMFCTIPVTIGRLLLANYGLVQPIHDLYTVSAGLYSMYLLLRLILLSRKWALEGWAYAKRVVKTVSMLLLRLFAAAVPLIGIIPLLLGIYFQLLVISPLRVSINQTPLFFIGKEWAMGVVHMKILCAFLLMGPDWWMKQTFEEIYAQGLWNFRLRDVYVKLVFPVVNGLLFAISFPYVFSKLALSFFNASPEEQVIVTRLSYPLSVAIVVGSSLIFWQWTKLNNLALKIRNEKYLVGTQLVNFYMEEKAAAAASAAEDATKGDKSQQAEENDAVETQSNDNKNSGLGDEPLPIDSTLPQASNVVVDAEVARQAMEQQEERKRAEELEQNRLLLDKVSWASDVVGPK